MVSSRPSDLPRPMPSRHVVALSSSLLLVACGDSGEGPDAEPSPAASSGMALVSNSICQVRGDTGVAIGQIDENGDLVPLSEEEQAEVDGAQPNDLVDCFAFPRTDLPSSGLSSTGRGSVRFDGRELALSGAIRAVGPPPTPNYGDEPPARRYNHLTLHDGETRVLRYTDPVGGVRIDYGVYESGVVLSFTLMTMNSEDDPAGRIYELVVDSTTEQEQALPDQNIAVDATFAVDLDGDGVISLPELFELTSGQFVWSETEEAPLLTFNFVIEDGRSVEGTYQGGYELVELPPW